MSELIHQKMAAILAEFPVVGKEQKNKGLGYNFRGVDDALGHAHNLLAKHGVYMLLQGLKPTFEVVGETKSGAAQWRCTVEGVVRFVCGEDGSYVEASLIGEGVDTGDKAMMKAQANGLKYVLWYTFCVPTEEKKDSEAFDEPEMRRPRKRKAAAPKESAAPAAPAKDELASMLDSINSCETIAELENLRKAVRELALSLPDGSPERSGLVEAFKSRDEALRG